jgi:competence protein ComEC
VFDTRNYFYIIVIGFCFGVAFVDILNISNYFLVFLCAISISIIAFLFLQTKLRLKDLCAPVMFGGVFILSFALGGFRINSLENSREDLPLNIYEGKNITFISKVIEANSKNILVSVFAVVVDAKLINISNEKIILSNTVGIFNYNDTLVIKGKLELPKNIQNESGRDFDYVSYLKRQGVYHIISFGNVLEQKRNDEITLRSLLYKIKNKFTENIESVVSEPESALATGVTIAGKGALPKDVQDDFIKAGIIHIVVLSGYNIALVIRAMMSMFQFLNRKLRIILAGTGIVLFVIMTGGGAPVVRSAVMATITLFGLLSYKTISQNRALLGAGFIMISINPYILIYDASFALSILATFAIINCVDIVKKNLKFVTERLQIRQVLAETLATQIFVLPYILYQIGRLSIVAPISNIIVLPLIPFIMMFTFIVGVIAFVPFISIPFAGVTILLCSLVIWIAHFLASIPYSSFEINYFPFWLMAVLYLFYFGVLYWFNKNMERVRNERATDTAEPY